MYRKRNGSLGFSFTRFANAAVPNFFADDAIAKAADLTPQRRDMCYMHQVASQDPFAFDDRVFYVAGVTDSEGMSKKVFKALKKHGLLREDSTVDTHKIGPNFTHQVAVINIVRQRELINMLFWWEEETFRLKKILSEESDLNQMIQTSEKEFAEDTDDLDKKQMLDQLKFARERIRMKKRQRPSQRLPEIENDSDDLMAAFHGRSMSCPTIVPPSAPNQDQKGEPPQYYPASDAFARVFSNTT